MTSPTYALSGLGSVEINFYFYASSMETGEDFWVRYNDGSGWQTVATYARGTNFNNNTFYTATVTLSAANFNLTNTGQFRFQCDASANNDLIYIDQVTVTGFATTLAGTENGAVATIEEIPTLRQFDTPVTNEVTIAPNPASDIVNITAGEAIEQITVFSIDGKQLMHRTYEGLDRISLQVGELPTGMYLISVQTEEARTTERLVIRR